MTWRQGVFAGLLLVLAVTVEYSVLSRLPLPGATPDLVTVTVVALALATRPVPGAIAGFAGGLAADIAPPAAGPVGVSALILMAVGFAVGLAADPQERSALTSVAIAAAACAGVTLAFAAITGLVGSARVRWEDMGMLLGTTALYGAVLAAFVLPGVLRLMAVLGPPARV